MKLFEIKADDYMGDTRKIKVMANNKEEAIKKVNDGMFKIFKLISVKEF